MTKLSDTTLQQVDSAAGARLREFSKPGCRLLTGLLFLWTACWADYCAAQQLTVSMPAPGGPCFAGCDFSLDGKFLVTGGDCLRLYHSDSGELFRKAYPIRPPLRSQLPGYNGTIDGFTDYLAAVEFPTQTRIVKFSSGNRNWLVSGSDDGTLLLWDLRQPDPLRRFVGHAGSIRVIAFSPTSQFMASVGQRQNSRGRTLSELFIWDLADGKRVYSDLSYRRSVACLAFSHDGRNLAFASNSDENSAHSYIQVMNTEDWTQSSVIEIASGNAYSIAFDQNGTELLISGGECVPQGAGGCRPTGKVWRAGLSPVGRAEPLAVQDAGRGYSHILRAPKSSQFLMRSSTVKQHSVVGLLQLRELVTGALIASVEIDRMHGMNGFALRPGAAQVACCNENTIEIRRADATLSLVKRIQLGSE